MLQMDERSYIIGFGGRSWCIYTENRTFGGFGARSLCCLFWSLRTSGRARLGNKLGPQSEAGRTERLLGVLLPIHDGGVKIHVTVGVDDP